MKSTPPLVCGPLGPMQRFTPGQRGHRDTVIITLALVQGGADDAGLLADSEDPGMLAEPRTLECERSHHKMT